MSDEWCSVWPEFGFLTWQATERKICMLTALSIVSSWRAPVTLHRPKCQSKLIEFATAWFSSKCDLCLCVLQKWLLAFHPILHLWDQLLTFSHRCFFFFASPDKELHTLMRKGTTFYFWPSHRLISDDSDASTRILFSIKMSTETEHITPWS